MKYFISNVQEVFNQNWSKNTVLVKLCSILMTGLMLMLRLWPDFKAHLQKSLGYYQGWLLSYNTLKGMHACSVVSDSLWPQQTVANQAPQFMGFPRQEYWGRLPFPCLGDLPDPEIKPGSPVLTGKFFTTDHLSSPYYFKDSSKWKHMLVRRQNHLVRFSYFKL